MSGGVDIYIGGDFIDWDAAGTRRTCTYTITYRAADACRNLTEATATVTVPHNQGVEAG